MESILIGVTLVSLGLAVTMTAVAWTLLRHERQRMAARVEALDALAFGDVPREPTRLAASAPPLEPIQTTMAGFDAASDRARVPAASHNWEVAILRRTDDHPDEAGSVPVSALAHDRRPDHLFEAAPASGAVGRRWLALAAVALLVAAGVALFSAFDSFGIGAALTASRPATGTPAGAQPLELLSLRHSTTSDGVFTVTGLVHNPPTGRSLESVEAVVYLFDSDDHYFASGRAALEMPAVQPGDESPFVVKLTTSTGVTRYRVGFRQPDGRTVAHVDRRGQSPAGTTGAALGDESERARPAGGMKPVDGALSP
jgi:hypothetical protein